VAVFFLTNYFRILEFCVASHRNRLQMPNTQGSRVPQVAGNFSVLWVAAWGLPSVWELIRRKAFEQMCHTFVFLGFE
jgi:hypothetical protein